MVATYRDYINRKTKFFQKHGSLYDMETTPLDEYESYTKTYIFEDGATWWEKMTPVIVTEEVEVKRINVNVDIKMLQTEYWDTEKGSEYYYEIY